jgi:hypothetical protein
VSRGYDHDRWLMFSWGVLRPWACQLPAGPAYGSGAVGQALFVFMLHMSGLVNERVHAALYHRLHWYRLHLLAADAALWMCGGECSLRC